METVTKSDLDQELLEQAAKSAASLSLSDLTAERLLQIAQDNGSDFATAVAYQCVRREFTHRSTISRVEKALEIGHFPRIARQAAFGLIPNLGYLVDEKSQKAGAKMFEAAAQLGFDTFVVPVLPTGDLETNAATICRTLEERTDERVILLSASKGSADLKIAFRKGIARSAFSRVVAWINVCGLLDGTAVVNTFLDQKDPQVEAEIIRWFQRRGETYVQHVIDALRECGRGPDRPLGCPLQIPPHIRVFHVVAFPLERHFLYEHSKILHQALLQLGPNDGFALLADLLNKPGAIYPVWGSDHYLDQAVDLTRLIRAVLYVVSEECGLVAL